MTSMTLSPSSYPTSLKDPAPMSATPIASIPLTGTCMISDSLGILVMSTEHAFVNVLVDFSFLCLKSIADIQWKLFAVDATGTTVIVVYMAVSLIQRLSITVKYYCGTTTTVLHREMSFV